MSASRHWPWVMAAATLALIPLMFVANQFEPEGLTEVIAAMLVTAGVASLVLTGALLATRVPHNPIGYLLLTAGVLIEASTVAAAYQIAATSGAGNPWPGTSVVTILGRRYGSMRT